MEFYGLDASFQPLNLIESYESLIWTERYSRAGDFEIVSSDIANLVKLLPLESYVSIRESTVPMIVENYKIEKPLRDRPKITITGRSFDTVLERRASLNKDLDPSPITYSAGSLTAWNIEADKESDAAYLAMRVVLGDVARYQGATLVLPVTNPAVSPLDVIPEIDLILPADYLDVYNTAAWNSATAYTTGQMVRQANYIWRAKVNNTNVTPSVPNVATWEQVSPYRGYEIKRQNLYNTVIELIETNRHGIKAVRPAAGSSKVGIEIYNGANLTGEGPGGDPATSVVIDARFDQVDDSTYLLSQQGSTNVGYVLGNVGAQVVLKNTAPEPTGLARRVLIVDNSSDTAASSTDILKTRGLIELYKYNATALFDGEVAEQVAAGYNKDYFLGDILKLVGEYGIDQDVRVAEFIRSEDSSGQKAYPTFEAVDE